MMMISHQPHLFRFQQDMNSQDGITLTMSPSEAIHILTTESGETMEISHNVLSDEISQADQSSTNEDDWERNRVYIVQSNIRWHYVYTVYTECFIIYVI